MKNFFLVAVCIIASTAGLNAQSKKYKAFKVDVMFGYAIPTKGGENTVGGGSFTLEPHYRLSDALALGLRMEGAGIGYKPTSSGDVTVSAISSYAATGEYYFMNEGFRPFVGAGAGYFTNQEVNVSGSSGSVTIPSESKFGFFPRAGFETGHFRINADYNIIGDGGYIAFKIGFFFGGGKK
jgi:outer membrane protein X